MQTNLYGLRNNIPGSSEFGELFYIGVGGTDRMSSHWRAGRKGCHTNALVQSVMTDHVTHNATPKQEVLVICPSHEYAYELEIKAIDRFGRKRLGLGCLCNISRGGAGPDTELMSDPAITGKISKSVLARYDDPKFREKQKEATRAATSTVEFKKAVSERTKAAFEDPAIRDRHVAALKIVNANQSSDLRSAVQAKSYVDNPERRVKVSVWATENNASPEVRESKSKLSTAANLTSWQDPLIRAKRIAGMQGKKKTMSAKALEARRLNAQKASAKRKAKLGESI